MKTTRRNGTTKSRRGHEAKNPGPPKRSKARKNEPIAIADSDEDEDKRVANDDWTDALWGDLVKDQLEHWNINDALNHGKSRGHKDPSDDKVLHRRGPRPNGESEGPSLRSTEPALPEAMRRYKDFHRRGKNEP